MLQACYNLAAPGRLTGCNLSPPQEKDLPMSKLFSALRRTFDRPYTEPTVHFHQGQDDSFPEVCHDEGACSRPRLQA